jgi:hypothetical protein
VDLEEYSTVTVVLLFEFIYHVLLISCFCIFVTFNNKTKKEKTKLGF